jgi:transcriptional regulator with XRE-family HTH domain
MKKIDRGKALVHIIDQHCQQRGWSASEFARRAGINRALISTWRNRSDVIPELPTLQKVAIVLDREVGDLWTEINVPQELQASPPFDPSKLSIEDLLELHKQTAELLAARVKMA